MLTELEQRPCASVNRNLFPAVAFCNCLPSHITVLHGAQVLTHMYLRTCDVVGTDRSERTSDPVNVCMRLFNADNESATVEQAGAVAKGSLWCCKQKYLAGSMPTRFVASWWMHVRGVIYQIVIALVLRGQETVLAWLIVHRYKLDWRSRILRQAPHKRYASCYRTNKVSPRTW